MNAALQAVPFLLLAAIIGLIVRSRLAYVLPRRTAPRPPRAPKRKTVQLTVVPDKMDSELRDLLNRNR
jgi:hypothetical protein